ncbi:MAG: formate/nitrite transporter family protein [Bacteroidales bacterium]|nr:formate/nitrite transporter family protein [Bacteroidales bacterium]
MNRQSTFAGILIGLGACGYLALGGIPGAVVFAFGLVGVVLSGTPLYTGRAGVMKVNELPALVKIWLFNILACAVIGLIMWYLGGEPMERAKTVVAGRLAQGPVKSFLRAVGCGLIIDIACWMYRSTKNLAPVLFGVPLFIVCGFYHSIADVVYLVAAGTWDNAILWYYPMIVLGNYAGCNIRRALLPKDFTIK